MSTSFVAAPAVPVAVNVTGLPDSVPDVAVSVFVPAVVLKVHDVAAAIPSVPVVSGVVGVTVPLPAAAAKVTATPDTGLPLASLTMTAGGERTAAPAGAAWGASPAPPRPVLEGGVVSASCVGPAAVTLNSPLVTGVRGAELAPSVWPVPALSMLAALKVATPFAAIC